MRLRPGVRVGPYEVVSSLGAGGMAEVYRARDTRLGRDIALKVINEVLSGDSELVRRFEQEARLTGSLNHPNLVAIHDFGLHDGAPYFVTELLEGESLRSRLLRGRIALSTALDWAAQMASGLAAAHGKGVMHRDVKPDNVFVTGDGKVKLLDFGIAKLAAGASAAGAHGLMEDTVTPTGGATATGAVIGTPGYMSPEQVRGEPLDPRTDLFSLGAVLYEMLSGRRAFQGTNPVESGYSILHADPEPLPPDVPLAVARIVQRCLNKEPARRFQSASDLAFALEGVRDPTGSVTQPAVDPRPRRRRAGWILGALAVGTLAAAGTVLAVRRPEPIRPPPALVRDAEKVTFRWGVISGARFLPDGRVAFSAAFEGSPEEIFVRPPGSLAPQSLGLPDARLLAASSTGELAVLVRPTSAVGFQSRGTAARVPSVGGIPREVAERSVAADWSPKGELALVRDEAGAVLEFPPGHQIFRTEGWISDLRFSPGGERIAVLHHPVIDDDMGEVLVLDLEGHSRALTKRWPTSMGLAWSPDGTEIWFTAGTVRKNTVYAVTPGGNTRELYRSLGDIQLADVARDGRILIMDVLWRGEVAYQAAGIGAQRLLSWTDTNDPLAALSSDGRALFTTQNQANAVSEGMPPVSVVFSGKDGRLPQVLGQGFALDLSADERWALVLSDDLKSLSAVPTGAGQPRSISGRGLEFGMRGGRWAPDGKSLLVVARPTGGGPFQLYRLAEDGSPPRRLGDATFASDPYLQVSHDGRRAAALSGELLTVIVSLQDGATYPLPLRSTERLVPRGWSQEGHLWITEGGRTSGARTRLLRLDPRSGKVLEERSIGPADRGGAGPMSDVVLSSDGREIAFSYDRRLNSLYVASGLGP